MSLESIRAFYARIRWERAEPRCRTCGRMLWNYPDDVNSSPVGWDCWACFVTEFDLDTQKRKDQQMAWQRSTAGTYSQLSCAESCPRQFDASYVSRRVKYQEDAKQAEGKFQHTQLRLRMGSGDRPIPLPADMQGCEPICRSLEKIGSVQCEVKLAVDPEFRGAGYDALTAWWRGDLDLLILKSTSAFIGDWKTGNSHFENPFQLKLYSMLVMCNYPFINEVRVANIWLQKDKQGIVNGSLGTVHTYTRERDLAETIGDLRRRWDMVERLKAANSFPPTPNPFCKTCRDYACQFNRHPDKPVQ